MSLKEQTNQEKDGSKKEIKKQGNNLENLVRDWVDSQEAKKAQEATDFLKSQKDIDVNETIEKHKENVQQGIVNYLEPVLLDPTQNILSENENMKAIDDVQVIDAYLNIIAWINKPEDTNVQTIIKQLTDKKLQLEQQKQEKENKETDQKAIDILSSTVDPKTLFETGSLEDFNAVMEFVNKGKENTIITNTTKDVYQKRVFDLVGEYYWDKDKIQEITIGKASPWFWPKFKENTWLIKYKVNGSTDNTDKFIARGTNEHLEDSKAQQAEAKGEFSENIFEAGKEGIQYFNKDRGYFQWLKHYLDIQWEPYTKQYLWKIIEGIKIYKIEDTDKDNESFIKNGFADMLTQYVINNPNLITTYVSYMRPENINMLGIDKTTRIKNFNFIVESATFKAIKKTDDQNKLIIELRSSIESKKQGNTIDTLGKMLVSLMSMLGIGKRGLKSIFPKNFWEKIDKIYAEEFALEKEEKEAITDLTKNLDTTDGEWRTAGIEKSYQSPSAKALQKNFEDKKAKEEFIKSISDLDAEQLGFIDPAIIQKGILFYNKDKNHTPVSQESLIDPKNRKVKVENKDKATFTAIITEIIDNESTRNTIAKANNNIWETVKDKNWKAVPSEYFNDSKEKVNYIINNAQDTWRYLASYLFAGSKDISYIVTENKLENTPQKPA